MLENIKTHPALKNFIEETCEENGIQTLFDVSIKKENKIVIKVDKYYESLRLSKTPASLDCLIIIKCESGGYKLYLIELKNISTEKLFDLNNVYAKFQNTIEKFMSVTFIDLFKNYDKEIKNIKLYFITDPYDLINKGVDNYVLMNKDIKGTKIEALLSKKPFRFMGRYLPIDYKVPDPFIKKC